jgi:hypothetical protein
MSFEDDFEVVFDEVDFLVEVLFDDLLSVVFLVEVVVFFEVVLLDDLVVVAACTELVLPTSGLTLNNAAADTIINL